VRSYRSSSAWRRATRTSVSWRAPRPPRTGRVVAVVVIAAIVLQLAIAQVTLALAVAFVVTAALSRWRPAWLFGPAVVGLVWLSAVGASRAWSGYAGGFRRLVALSQEPGALAGHLRATGAALGQWHHWLPGQIPFALIVASAQASVVCRLARRNACRPGLIVAVRRCYVSASLRRGDLATADGACLGVVTDTGRRAAVSWQESAGGVLVTGQDAGAVTRTGLSLATAAILHRKTVIIVDLAGGQAWGKMGDYGVADVHVLRGVTSASDKVSAPLAVFGSDGYYQPFAGARGDAAADLVLSMTDWTGVSEARRAFCADYVATAIEVVATPTTASAQQRNILDELAGLLRPGALDGRACRAADAPLRRRAATLGSQLCADPSATSAMTEQLAWLRRSPAWTALCGPSDGAKAIDIGLALASRQVLLFPLDPRNHGPAGPMIARLVLADLARVLAERSGAPADCVVWVNGYEVLGGTPVEAVIAHGVESGVATIVGTAAGPAAAALQSLVNVVVVRGRRPPGVGDHRTTVKGQPGPAGAGALCHEVGLDDDRAGALSLLVRGPVPRLLQSCRVVW
jgi:hypothetical protein